MQVTTPSENWPKPWMLNLHEQAVTAGMIWVEGITEPDYRSLKQRLYRIRRRGDRQMAAFIKPEYHLVMVGNWERVTDANGNSHSDDHGLPLGRFPMIFNSKADGSQLPTVRSATGEELAVTVSQPQLSAPSPLLSVTADDLVIKGEEIESLVDQLRRSAKQRLQDGE